MKRGQACDSCDLALTANGATATAQNYTQDGVIANAHVQPSFANDGQRYAHLTATDADGFWRDEHGLSSWLQVDLAGTKVIHEIGVYTVKEVRTGARPTEMIKVDGTWKIMSKNVPPPVNFNFATPASKNPCAGNQSSLYYHRFLTPQSG